MRLLISTCVPRASDYLIQGYTYHLTQWHNRKFLLRFAVIGMRIVNGCVKEFAGTGCLFMVIA